jgi:hypothetical protein
MLASPAPIAVTTPRLDTLATCDLSELQVAAATRVVPSGSVSRASNGVVLPM